MPFHNTILYPKKDDATFDMKYYLDVHMPLVGKEFGKHGLKGWTILQFGPGPDGAMPPYTVQATLEWEDISDFQKAMGSPEKDAVFGDVPNFSNHGPMLMGGQVMGKS